MPIICLFIIQNIKNNFYVMTRVSCGIKNDITCTSEKYMSFGKL